MDYLPDIGQKPDWGMGLQYSLDIEEVKLGDGYTQSRPKGINSVSRVFAPSWTTLSKAQKDQLVDFLKGTKGVTPFIFVDPDGDEEVKVKCGKVINVEYTQYDGYSVSVTLTEDFNP